MPFKSLKDKLSLDFNNKKFLDSIPLTKRVRKSS